MSKQVIYRGPADRLEIPIPDDEAVVLERDGEAVELAEDVVTELLRGVRPGTRLLEVDGQLLGDPNPYPVPPPATSAEASEPKSKPARSRRAAKG